MPEHQYHPSPIKNTPIRIPPPSPFIDASNYLHPQSTSRTRQNILNLINAHEESLQDAAYDTNPKLNSVNLLNSSSHFNSLSRSSARISSDDNGSSLPRSLVSSSGDDFGLPALVTSEECGLPTFTHGFTLTRNGNISRPAISQNSRVESVNVSHDSVDSTLHDTTVIANSAVNQTNNLNNQSRDQSVYESSTDNYITSTVSRNWEYVNVSLTRVPGYGFGIAVSGGCDNPHFANGDPAIAISDVLKGGPAQGKLQINDRIISANGISLDNVDYSTAVQILRDSGPSVNLRVKRRVNPQSYKVSVPLNSKRLKKLSFESLGFTVSVTLQIKTVDSQSLGLREGDLIDKIQGLRVNELFNEKVVCKELRRVLEESNTNGNSTNLNLTVKRSGSNRNANQPHQNPLPPQQPSSLHQPSHSVGNLYVQPPTRANNKSFDSTNTPLPPPPPSAFAPPVPPPRPPLPSEFENQQPPVTTHPLRSINFIKQNQLGIRLSGGNKTGIIVSAVQKNSQADLQGLSTNDKIIRVNEHDFLSSPPTREQAIEILSSIPNDTLVNLTVEKLGNVQLHDNQDEFYVRTRVATDDFKLHEVLLVTDTLVNGLVGQWEAYRLDHQGNRLDKIIIPNMKNARELLKKSWKRTTSFRNREYEDLLQCLPATDPYEIVERRTADMHVRPVLLYTPTNSNVIECLMMMKHASRLFKVVRNVDELDFNDGRVRIVNEVVSIRGLQELHEKRIYPFVVFGNFMSKDGLKEALKDAGKYSKCKKLYSVLHKVKDKLGSYVDMAIELRDCEGGADRIYDAIVQQGGQAGRGVFFAAARGPPHPSISSPQQTSTTPKRSQSTPRTPSHQKDSSTHHHRPSSSSHHHHRHKSTDSLAGTSNNNNHHRTPTSPSPASMNSLKFPNFNIPPPQSIIETNPVETTNRNSDYDKRVNLVRSATSVGTREHERPDTRSTHHPTTPTALHNNPLTNNFAHSPVLDRRDYNHGLESTTPNTRRAQSNPPPGGVSSPIRTGQVAQGMGGAIPPPMIDRSKKPGSNVFYPINANITTNNSSSPSTKLTPKPAVPPKPRGISGNPSSSSSQSQSKSSDVNRSLFRPVHPNGTGDSQGSSLRGDDDTGQTYLNIPMNSKAAIQAAQQQQQQREFLQQQQQQQQQPPNITSGYFDWRGGRLVQKHTYGSQIPIEVFIPEGAIPHGETVNVWFQIVDYNVREDNQNPLAQKKMLSPLVKFGPENYRFKIPVEIRIPQYTANGLNGNDNNMLAKVLMNNHSDYWTKIDIQNGNYSQDNYNSDVKVVSLTVQQF